MLPQADVLSISVKFTPKSDLNGAFSMHGMNDSDPLLSELCSIW